MPPAITVIHVDDVPIERMEEREGWAISEFRLPITGDTGSATTVFHSIFRPGSTHAKHLHDASDEIAVYLSGHGVVGQSNSRAVVSAGHCRLMPKGSEHFFFNETENEDAEVIGFYMGAGSVPATGYKFCGMAQPEDLAMPRGGLNEGILVTLDESQQAEANGYAAWADAALRWPIGSHNGSENALIHASIPAGKGLKPYVFGNCEQIYFVNAGTGTAGSGDYSAPLRRGHFVFVPRGVDHWLENTGDAPLEIFDVLTGADGLDTAGYRAAD